MTPFQREGQGEEGDHQHPWEGRAGRGWGSAALGGREAGEGALGTSPGWSPRQGRHCMTRRGKGAASSNRAQAQP